ncbi:hypothetical protein D3C76_940520 [compost metagenome]
MLLLFLLLILVTAIVANVQLHKWKRQQRLGLHAATGGRSRPAPKGKDEAEVDLDGIDWEGLGQEELDLAPPAPPPVQKTRPEPVKTAPPVARPSAPPKPEAKAEPGDAFSPLERALLQDHLSGAQRREAMTQLLAATLHAPTPEPGERHVILDMDGGSYVPVATHPAAATIALGHLAEHMTPLAGSQLLRDLRGSELGLLVVARNPRKPSVARLWKIQPEDL